jgi:hypothetical protein
MLLLYVYDSYTFMSHNYIFINLHQITVLLEVTI